MAGSAAYQTGGGKSTRVAIDEFRKLFLLQMREYFPALLSPETLDAVDATRRKPISVLKELEGFPPGTLGHEYRKYFLDHDIDVPGEGNSVIPGWYAYHDILHLLCDYPVNARGELELAAFTAGFSRLGWISVLKTVMMFQYGVPLVRGVPTSFGVVGLADLRRAYARGKRVKTNLMTWDFRAHWSVPMSTLRRELNIEPR